MENDIIPQIDISCVQELKLREIDFIDNDFAIFDDASEIPMYDSYPNRINAAILAVCLKGHAKVAINLKEYDLETSSLLMTLPDQIIQNIGASDDYSGIFIAVSPQFIDRTFTQMKELLPFMFYIKEHPCVPLNESELNCMIEYHSFLWKKVKMKDNIYRREIAKGILSAMFYDIHNFCRKHMPMEGYHPKTRMEELFEKFMHDVSSSYRMERSVTFYANKLCLTPKHLSGVVKEVSGKTAGEWIDDFVILEARALLKSSEMSVQEIAEYLHFANQSFFGKYFKHYVGMSPKEYRRS